MCFTSLYIKLLKQVAKHLNTAYSLLSLCLKVVGYQKLLN